MDIRYEDLKPAWLAQFGFENPAQASEILQRMAGHDVPDTVYESLLNAVVPALGACADPDRAAANLDRWADAVPNRLSFYNLLAAHPAAVQILVTVFAASQFFADILIQTPEYLEVLLNPSIRDRSRDRSAFEADLARRIASAATPNAKREAIRQFKPPEILRIGVRDLLGYADMPETTREISDFADTCVAAALEICQEEHHLTALPFAVIAMGKLGGRELNYASDIDLIFIHGDRADPHSAIALGKSMQDTLAHVTRAGFIFRVDLRLRPEGRFGPISRSLESCRAYYESWAEPWERQALLKARWIAGDQKLGAAFIAMAEAYVYRPHVEESFIQSIQMNKKRMENKVRQSGDAAINVKEGIGGIRDIEFLVQLMQLIVGGKHPDLRTGNTLHAIPRLVAHRFLSAEEGKMLSEDYQFLRTVEHRLQILDERPVRLLPSDAKVLRKFARRLGYPDEVAFQQDFHRRTNRVNALFQHLFYGESGTGLAAPEDPAEMQWASASDDGTTRHSLLQYLEEAGLHHADQLLPLVVRSLSGSEYGGVSPEAREAFLALFPRLIQCCAATDDPDTALQGILQLADAVPSRAALFHSLQEQSSFLLSLCQLAAKSRFLWLTLLEHLQYLDLIADTETMDQPPALSPAKDISALAMTLRRARLQTGVRNVWKKADTTQVLHEVTQTAGWALASALEIACREVGFDGRIAIIGFGKLGGSELGYASDLDIVFATEPEHLTQAAAVAARVQKILSHDLTAFGFHYEVDMRLRPEGTKGALALDLETYRRYYQTAAATWERHALMKARPVAGDKTLQREFALMAEEVVYDRPWTKEEGDEIRRMKRRIETERLSDPNDLKLALGGLSDIEWTTQMLQLKWGGARRRLRTTNTLQGLRALRDDALIRQSEWETLTDTYLHLTGLRNDFYLGHGVAGSKAKSLTPATQEQMQAVRVIVEQRFYAL